MPFFGPADDLAAIHALCQRYCQGVIAYDFALWSSCWIEDARWVRPDATITGRDAITAAASKILNNYDTADFVAHLNDAEIEGNRAHGRCYHTELFGKNGELHFYLSHYDDKYLKQNGEWLFAERSFTLLETRRFKPA